ncbi:transposase family protein [Bacillus thuringiensis]|uniref:Transposase n=1 Tax=Bacillus cereus TaxID=1396 RepID=A0A9W7UQC6_BACCE|nr:transposase family protein [Bacillus cereus]KAA6460472.1 transposase [Bacillus cereus]KAB2500216.1 transposase [Bacillus cereus]
MENIIEMLEIPNDMELLSYIKEANRWLFHMQSITKSSCCPNCNQRSCQRHSGYTRHVQDLPIATTPVFFQISIRKWYCTNAKCTTKVFCERFSWLPKHKRYTSRLETYVKQLAFTTNCLQAGKLCQHVHILISHDTLLPIIYQAKIEPKVSPFCGY